MEEHPWKGYKYAFAFQTSKLIGTKAHSGWSIATIDPDSTTLLHSPDISDVKLGEFVCQSLRESQAWSFEKGRSYLHDRTPYETWVGDLMVFGGDKSPKAATRNLKEVLIYSYDGQIVFIPSRNKRGAFEGLSKEFHVIVPEDSAKADIGAALRLAFERSM